MCSVEHDNAIYANISLETRNKKENEYEVPNELILEKLTRANEPLISPGKSNAQSKCSIVLALAVVVLVLAVVAACVVFALEITEMKTEMSRLSAQMLSHNQALSEKLDKVMINSEMVIQQAVNNVSEKLSNVTVQVTQDYSNKIQQLASSSNTSLQQVSEEYMNLTTSLQQLNGNISAIESALIGQSQNYPVPSCASLHPSSPSGYYWVGTGHAVHVYCDMTCGNIAGGWRRVAGLDMTNSGHQCPSNLSQRTDSNLRTCVRTNSSSAGCSSVTFSTSSINYTNVCGRVIAYQNGTTDAFNHELTINDIYVDGVSLTHGTPREHIWTFASAHDELINGGAFASCPCIDVRQVDRVGAGVPSFVGDDYFCDTGSHQRSLKGVFYSGDPLWDGAGCGHRSTCCSFNNPPWFYKQLPQPTTDDIEMRVCRSQASSDEDVAIIIMDVFVS